MNSILSDCTYIIFFYRNLGVTYHCQAFVGQPFSFTIATEVSSSPSIPSKITIAGGSGQCQGIFILLISHYSSINYVVINISKLSGVLVDHHNTCLT